MITPEQQAELEKFPEALRALVQAELAAGNAIEEIGHSFPAPPVGAFIKLVNKVTTRARSTSDGLNFYERHSSLYSGQFTDAVGYFFVLEPPNPPPPEPDMDAARIAMEATSESVRLSNSSIDKMDIALVDENTKCETPTKSFQSKVECSLVQMEETDTGSTRVMHFTDRRAPQEIQQVLERELTRIFSPTLEGGTLCWRANAIVIGAPYEFLLRFEAALPTCNAYSLRMDVSWAGHSSENRDYFRKNCASWFSLWTREFSPAAPIAVGEGSVERYRQQCEVALNADRGLDSVEAIQHAIITAVKRGATFQSSHKEGGTKIYWRNDRFMRSDYGDYPDDQQYRNESDFLKMLAQFFQWEVMRNAGNQALPDIEFWRLILRLASSG